MIIIGREPTEQERNELKSSFDERKSHNDQFGRIIIKEMFKKAKYHKIIDNDTPTIWKNYEIPLEYSIDLKIINTNTLEIKLVDVEYCDITNYSPKGRYMLIHNRKPNNITGYCKHKEWELPNRRGIFRIYPNSNECYFIKSELLQPLINSTLPFLKIEHNQWIDFSFLYNKTVIRDNNLNYDEIKISNL